MDSSLNRAGDLILSASIVIGADDAVIINADIAGANRITVVGVKSRQRGAGRATIGTGHTWARRKARIELPLDEAVIAIIFENMEVLLDSGGDIVVEAIVVVGLNNVIVHLTYRAATAGLAVLRHQHVVSCVYGIRVLTIDVPALVFSIASALL